MAYRVEKNGDDQDLVFDGWEQGIAPSPHKGIANIQNGNISTETGEVTAAFSRLAQLTSTSSAPVSGTLTASVSDGNYVLDAGVTSLSVGQWINVSAATVQVPKTTETVNILAAGGGGGGGGTGSNANNAAGGGGAGQVATNSALAVSVAAYPITLGTGGTAGANTGGNGGTGVSTTVAQIIGVTPSTLLTAIGGGGGAGVPNSNGNGVGGASGGGGGDGGTATGGTGAAGTAGNNGGNSFGTVATNAFGGGGGGAGGAGANGSVGGLTGGAGGIGTSSSISGASAFYGGGGGGGAAGSSTTPGAGGSSIGGAGGDGAGGVNATANTGSGGGGAGGTSHAGGTGSAGTVVISYPTGNITATGGTITTSGGNTIHTFTSSGTFTITAINTTQVLPAGNYFIDYASGSKVKFSTSFDSSGLNPQFHGTSGTITFSTIGQLAKPIAKTTETYSTTSTVFFRYYILDSNGLVWVNDSGVSNTWMLTSPTTTYYGSQAAPSGLAVLNGWLLVFSGTRIFAKPTINLGTAFTDMGGDAFTMGVGSSTIPHYAYVGHQGRCYYTDRNYIGSIFPDTSIRTGGNNVQSYSSYTAVTTQGTISAIIGGSAPQVPVGSSFRIPAAFFTDAFGTMPTAVTTGVIYWIDSYASNSGSFLVYGESQSTTVTTTGALSANDTSATLNTNWTGPTKIELVSFSNNDTRNVQFTHGSSAINWITGLSGSATTSISLGTLPIDIQTGAVGNQYFNTFYPIGTDASAGGITPTVTFSNQRLNLPTFEVAQCMTEVGNTIIIGCMGNVLYPWNQVDLTPSTIITLPEADTKALLTVNQMAYSFTGNNGNVYITDGSVASLVLNIPDYCAGIPGSPGTYIEPNYYWQDAMYLRGRVYFSVRDQTSTKTGNCGGIWSFVPTQNLYIGQDTGIALRLEAKNSYLTYNGAASILIPTQAQDMSMPLYWTGWYSDYISPTYGIDYSNSGTLAGSPTVVETDLAPTGTFLDKKTFKQIEYKLSAPLDTGATVTLSYRTTGTAAWASCGTVNTDSDALSGYVVVNFEKTQWLQLQATLTPITSSADTNTFIRFRELRVR